ncbi:YfhO family protein [Streptomyces sp. Je 1-79]|uniref:YfhO family protein n=1 Tax=Streptomyces sp. Je 1-79 TaxID=2943847 RepID=UPI0021A83E94|nr:YfhO family protein [Streptomyces sp. Je 1-79]MCT4352479.1 YfhO family protein [Streptomyces sp. Je 1-79]
MPPAAETVPDQGEGAHAEGDRPEGERPGAADGPEGGPARLLARARRSVRVRAAGAAALLTCLVLCAVGMFAGSHPFGPTTRNTVDLGQQYLPYHAHWRRLLLGRADGDLFLNWSAGFGSNFLGDYGTYLSSPFDLMVVLFPADRIELALYVVTAAKITTAGAAMAVLLLRLRRGPWQVAAVLGAAYALCGWTLNYGATVPMWLDGLLAFPLLCLVGEWARTARRPLLGPLVVALAWFANFYTAYMATLGAAVVLTVRLLTAGTTARRRLAGLLRAARSVLLGIGLATPLVLVIFLATRVADPTPEVTFTAVPWTEVFARLLPATASVATPALFIGTPALALALTLPFNSAVAPRIRIAWTAAVCLVALSLQWGPTHLLWHAGSSPNGLPYRQTFVLCGLLLIAAWLSTARGLPPLPALLGAAALLAALAFGARGSLVVDRWTYPAFAAALALAVLAATAVLIARRYAVGARALPALAVVLLVLAQAGETAVTGGRIAEQELTKVQWNPRLGPWQEDMARAVEAKNAWPRQRTDPGELPGGNDVLLVGGQGAEYYSSLTSETYSRTLSALGFGYWAKGRHPVTLDNPVTDAIFSIGTRMRSTPTAPLTTDTPPEAAITVTGTPVPPLVTVRPDVRLPARATAFGDSPFANQELLLGTTVYAIPDRLRRTDGPGGVTTLTASCPAGTQLWLWAPELKGTASLDGGPPVSFFGGLPSVQGPMQTLGTVPASGAVRIELHGSASQSGPLPDLPRQPVGCLERERLDTAVRQLTATGATSVHVSGHTLTAELPAGSTGTAVVAAPRISGWHCAAGDDDPAPAQRYLGLLAVPIDSTTASVRCTFRPPGLRLGGAIAAVALIVLLAPVFRRRFARRVTRVHLESASASSGGR